MLWLGFESVAGPVKPVLQPSIVVVAPCFLPAPALQFTLFSFFLLPPLSLPHTRVCRPMHSLARILVRAHARRCGAWISETAIARCLRMAMP